MKRITWFAIAVTLLFAGCTGAPELMSLRAADTTYTFTDYTWALPVVTNGTGAIVADHPFVGDPDAPFFVQQMLPGQGAEPNIGVTSEGNLYVTVFDETQKSSDYGRNWSVVHEYVSPAPDLSRDYWSTSDPMLWVDPDTDRVYTVHMQGTFCVFLAWSDDEGATWTERPYGCGTPLLDHPKVMTAPYGPASLASLSNPAYPNVLYLCINKYVSVLVGFPDGMGTWCAVSLDGGASFAYDRQIAPGIENCASINGHPAAFPDGTVVVPLGSNFNSACPRGLTLVVTEDNGLTWTRREVPKQLVESQVEIDPDVTITPDGVAYVFFRDGDQMGYLLRSRDKFQTFEGPWRVAPEDQTVNAFTVATSGSDGRLSLAYLGTKTPQVTDVEPSNVTGGTIWHLYTATILNGLDDEPLFYTQQVTPEEDPVQVGCIWFYGGGGGGAGCRNLLDFIDSVHDEDGRVAIAFTDGCTPRTGCTTDPDAVVYQSRDRQIAVAIQDSGWSLFDDREPLPRLGLSPPRPIPR